MSTIEDYRAAARRELGTILRAKYGVDPDHDVLTCDVYHSSGQGFGGVVLDEKIGPDFVQQLCETFGVTRIEDLVGKECYALRCWGFMNDAIEGLESVDTGRRFVLTSWLLRHFPDTKSPAIMRRRRILSDIQSHQRSIGRLTDDLDNILVGYVDWSDQ